MILQLISSLAVLAAVVYSLIAGTTPVSRIALCAAGVLTIASFILNIVKFRKLKQEDPGNGNDKA